MTEIHDLSGAMLRSPRWDRSDGNAPAEPAAENLNSLIRRVAYASVNEIDGVILELKRIRDTLDSERERLIRDIARYASLNHSLMTATKIVSERLKQWEGTPMSREQAMADFKARWLGGDGHRPR